jgi:hypothetical protein
MFKPTVYVALGLGLAAAPQTQAQTTGSVFGPGVSQGEREAEYRLGVEWEEAGDTPSLAHRFHIQTSMTDALRWRLIAAWEDPAHGDLELDYVQGELLWQILETTPSGYASAVRFDARISEGDNTPHEIGLNWTNQWTLNDQWRLRALVLFDRDVGPNAKDDWILETRASLSRRFENGYRITLESFNEFGGLDAGFGGFDDQNHQLGPVLSGPLAYDVDWSAGLLFGLSDSAPEQDLVLRLSRPF